MATGSNKIMQHVGNLYVDTEKHNQNEVQTYQGSNPRKESPNQIAPKQRPNSRRGQWLREGKIASYTSPLCVTYKPGGMTLFSPFHFHSFLVQFHLCTYLSLGQFTLKYWILNINKGIQCFSPDIFFACEWGTTPDFESLSIWPDLDWSGSTFWKNQY
jgi:hypothetical protein